MKIDVDLKEEKQRYFLSGAIVNFGTSPAYFSIKKEDVRIKIGDEEYSATHHMQAIAFPGDKTPPSFEIGHINQNGVRKLLNKEYKDNTAHIYIKMDYYPRTFGSLGSRFFSYSFEFKYGIEFLLDSDNKVKITIFVIEQKFV